MNNVYAEAMDLWNGLLAVSAAQWVIYIGSMVVTYCYGRFHGVTRGNGYKLAEKHNAEHQAQWSGAVERFEQLQRQQRGRR